MKIDTILNAMEKADWGSAITANPRELRQRRFRQYRVFRARILRMAKVLEPVYPPSLIYIKQLAEKDQRIAELETFISDSLDVDLEEI